MAGGGGSIADGEPEFQVAPMIDVLLVMLVFFMMITSAQVLKVDKRIKLPVAKDAIKKDTTRKEAVVNVGWDPSTKIAFYKLDDRTYADAAAMIDELAKRKKDADADPLKQGGPPFRAVIRGDRGCPAIYVSKAMESCSTAGISDVSFSAVNKNY